MTSFQRSRTPRVLAAIAIALSLASGGYFLLPPGHTIAQVAAPAAPPAEALNQANTLSDAFRNSADKVLPAVVSIRNEIQPRLAKADSKGRGQRPQLPKGLEGQLPRGFGGGELDPFLRRFF